MKKLTLYSHDIECESCERVISKVLNKLNGVESYSVEDTRVEVSYDPKSLKEKSIMAAIEAKGYRTSTKPVHRKHLKSGIKDFVSDRKKYAHEYKFLTYFVVTFALLMVAEWIYYVNRTPGFGNSFTWLFYSTLTVLSLGAAIWHFKSYKVSVTCMTGMMVGMTIGMQTGMMVGTILSATVGFVFGATLAMVVSAIVGAYIGNCCGIMGVLQGLMAGGMGGIMGAMIGSMMMGGIMTFMPFFMGLHLLIMVGMAYMTFEELAEGRDPTRKSPGKFSFLVIMAVCVVALIATIEIGSMYASPMMMDMGGMDMSGMDMGSMDMGTGMPMENMDKMPMDSGMEDMPMNSGMDDMPMGDEMPMNKKMADNDMDMGGMK